MGKQKSSQSNSHEISESDRQLFRQTVGEVEQIDVNLAEPSKQPPKAEARQQQLDDQHVMESLAEDPFAVDEVETGDELSFIRPGIQKQTLRKLRRGQFVIEQELDLHGHIVAEAKPALNHFLQTATHMGKRCVRIIHGKGLGSKNNMPVIKNKLNLWLQQDDRVLAFCSARPNDGGTGAVYVLLKKFV